MRSGRAKTLEPNWLEDNQDVNMLSLLRVDLDVDKLTGFMRQLLEHVSSNANGIARMRAEHEKLSRLLADQKRVSSTLEAKCRDLSDELARVRMELQVLAENKEGKLVLDEMRSVNQMEVAVLKEELRRIDSCKMDKNSPQIEADARKYSLETVKSFFTTRNKELRSWVEKKLSTLQTLLQGEAQEQTTAQTNALNNACEGLEQQISSSKSSLLHVINEQGDNLKLQGNKITSICSRMMTMEEEYDMGEAEVTNDLMRLQKEVRLLYSVFSTCYTELSTHACHEWDYRTPADARHDNEKDQRYLSKLQERVRQWGLIQSGESNSVPWDANEFEARAKINVTKAKLAEHELVLGTAIAKAEKTVEVPDAVISHIHGGRVFTEFRSVTDTFVNKIISYSIEDMKDDLTQEAQSVARDLKAKITAQRCVELIQEHIGRAFIAEKEAVKQRMDMLDQSKIGTSQVHEMLKVKADVGAMQLKADRAIMLEMFDFVNSKIGVESSDDTVKRAVRQINSKIEELQASKLDKNDPELKVMLSMVTGNVPLSQGPAISVSRPSSARRQTQTPSGTRTYDTACLSCNTTTTDAHVEGIIKAREREKQEAQEHHHQRQMALSTAKEIQHKRELKTLAPPVDVDAYITNLATAKPLVPAPPPACVIQGIDPRHIT